mmetsp:Transcript_4338/g.9387  ORF Transcript_4338/g.9387 Transcript_4338/m.9387 type:complete len:257 (+) Transcript_4338:1268-2038(+)
MKAPNFRNSRMSETRTPWQKFYECCFQGDTQTAQLLLAHEKTVRDLFAADHTDELGRNVLHVASYGGHLSTVRFLSRERSNFEEQLTGRRNHKWAELADNNSWTPLFCACWWGHQMVAEFWIRFGSNLLHKDNKGFGPLERAFMAGRKPLIDYLLMCAVITKDDAGFTRAMPRGGQGSAEEETETITLDDLHSKAESFMSTHRQVQADHSHAGSGWGAEAAKDWTEVDLDLSGVSIHLPSQGIEFRNKDGTEYHDS